MPYDASPRPTEILTRPETVRVATRADEEALFELLWNSLYVDNCVSATLVPDEKRVRAHIEACCRGTSGIAGIIDGPKGIAASIGLVWSYAWYSQVGFIAEMWCFTVPGERAGHRHYQAMRRFSLWHRADLSAKAGYPISLETSCYSFNRLPAKTRLWRQGQRQVGSVFWVEGNA